MRTRSLLDATTTMEVDRLPSGAARIVIRQTAVVGKGATSNRPVFDLSLTRDEREWLASALLDAV